MFEAGDLSIFGFRIGPDIIGGVRDISIFVNGFNLTERDCSAYLPSFIGDLRRTAAALKRKIDYVRYEMYFGGRNVTQIHNLLLHGDATVFHSDSEWWAVRQAHQFAEWGETTDGFTMFLVPYLDRLYLTYQLGSHPPGGYQVLDVVRGVEITPFYLIETIERAVSHCGVTS